jgi:DNA-binding response OmpR family regulator
MRILIIEDETKVANFLKKGLEQSGYYYYVK